MLKEIYWGQKLLLISLIHWGGVPHQPPPPYTRFGQSMQYFLQHRNKTQFHGWGQAGLEIPIFVFRNIISCGFVIFTFCFLISEIKIYANAWPPQPKEKTRETSFSGSDPVLSKDIGRVVHVLWETMCWPRDVSC